MEKPISHINKKSSDLDSKKEIKVNDDFIKGIAVGAAIMSVFFALSYYLLRN